MRPTTQIDVPDDQLIGYFGYGSLVNLATLTTPYLAAVACTLTGWRRRWQARPQADGAIALPGRALLSVFRDRECAIDGMLIIDHIDSLPELDIREHHYRRVALSPADLTFCGAAPDIVLRLKPGNLFVYEGAHALPGQPPLLQSYVHTVMDGFLAAHGEAGLNGFLRTTDGFERAIITDWREPIYPRMTLVCEDVRARYDAMLRSVGVRYPSDD